MTHHLSKRDTRRSHKAWTLAPTNFFGFSSSLAQQLTIDETESLLTTFFGFKASITDPQNKLFNVYKAERLALNTRLTDDSVKTEEDKESLNTKIANLTDSLKALLPDIKRATNNIRAGFNLALVLSTVAKTFIFPSCEYKHSWVKSEGVKPKGYALDLAR